MWNMVKTLQAQKIEHFNELLGTDTARNTDERDYLLSTF